MRVRVRVKRTFALGGQGVFVEGREIEMEVTRQAAIAVAHPNEYERLVREGYVEELEAESGVVGIGYWVLGIGYWVLGMGGWRRRMKMEG